MSKNKLKLVLQLADNALVMGHRISEWCGHGPALEQDIAITNTSLDHLGQARSLYQYAADLYNNLPTEDKDAIFNTKINATEADEDTLPYLRDAWDYYNALLLEQPNKDWAYTIARSFFYDQFMFLYYTELSKSEDESLKAIAQKSLKEVTYHKKWSSEWMIRLGDGTDVSHEKIQNAVADLWQYTGELMMNSKAENELLANGDPIINNETLKADWLANVNEVLEEATITLQDPNAWMHNGGKEGTHSEHLGFILADLQFVQRAYPNMKW